MSDRVNQLFARAVSAISVTPTCPRCKRAIPSEDINVANDIAFCRNCNLSHSLSALTSGTAVDDNIDVNQPPAGSWFEQDGNGIKFGATHRSVGQAFGLLLFTLFWNGIVSVFVVFALTSTLHRFGVAEPAWFRHSKSNFVSGGMLLFLWLFLLPFIVIGLSMVIGFLNCLLGWTELRVQGDECVLFSGVGPLGRNRRFAVSEVTDVRIDRRQWQDSNGGNNRSTRIVIETNGKPIYFGSFLSAARRQFVAAAAKKELVRR